VLSVCTLRGLALPLIPGIEFSIAGPYAKTHSHFVDLSVQLLDQYRHTIEDCERLGLKFLLWAVEPGSHGRRWPEIDRGFENELNVGSHRILPGLQRISSKRIPIVSIERLAFAPCHLVKHNQLTLQVYLKPIQDQVVQNAGKGAPSLCL